MRPTKELIKESYKAFPNAAPTPFSDGCPREQCVDLDRRFGTKKREDYTTEDVDILSANLPILPGHTTLYTLPRLLEACLLDPTTIQFDTFIHAFLPDSKNAPTPIMTLLDTTQRKLIREFLEHLTQKKTGFEREITQALRDYKTTHPLNQKKAKPKRKDINTLLVSFQTCKTSSSSSWSR